jgi:hypothetical protein
MARTLLDAMYESLERLEQEAEECRLVANLVADHSKRAECKAEVSRLDALVADSRRVLRELNIYRRQVDATTFL